MNRTYEKETDDLMAILEMVPDPRHKRGIRYKLSDLLLMLVYAALCGHSEGSEIAYYVELRIEYFKELIGLKKVPSHDTFSRIIQMVDFKAFSEMLGEWLWTYYPDICKRYGEYRVLHADGKAIKGAAAKSDGESPVYMMNAMYEGESIGLKLTRIGEKENEISALPGFLKMFNLEKTIVTIDAIGCNSTVIRAIEEGGGKYVLPVKENQKKLLRVINAEIERIEKEGRYKDLPKAESLGKAHGRMEKIGATLIEDTTFVYREMGEKSCFSTVSKVLVVDKESQRKEKGEEKTTHTRRIMITDLEEITVNELLKIHQSHWNVEMQHWLLDVQLDEDRKTARKGNAATNAAILRRLCLAVRAQDPELSEKPMKRFLMANEHDEKRVERILFGHMI
jgi:predicted transposase YbfD/YdcC